MTRYIQFFCIPSWNVVTSVDLRISDTRADINLHCTIRRVSDDGTNVPT